MPDTFRFHPVSNSYQLILASVYGSLQLQRQTTSPSSIGPRVASAFSRKDNSPSDFPASMHPETCFLPMHAQRGRLGMVENMCRESPALVYKKTV